MIKEKYKIVFLKVNKGQRGSPGAGHKDSNRDPEEIKCSLKQANIVCLSVTLPESIITSGGSSLQLIFPKEALIIFQNLLGLFRFFVVSLTKYSDFDFLMRDVSLFLSFRK